LAGLAACTTKGCYARVTTNNNESFEDKQFFLPGNQHLHKSNFIITGNIKKYPVVTNKWPTHSMNSGSSDDYQRPTLWKKKLPPATLLAEIKTPKESVTARKKQTITGKINTPITNETMSEPDITYKKQPDKLNTVQNRKDSQKKSIIPIKDKKKLTLNFDWPMQGKVLRNFSPSHNKGIDIAGKQKQSVKATEAGTIVYGGQGLIGFGQLLIIKHNAFYLSAYANNSQLFVKKGQYVQKGQLIAEVGKAGIKRSSLHFEIRKNGKPLNPLNFLPNK
jgi:murein DD-endopeptidase MepM/ murein hydrolase activator NlpD